MTADFTRNLFERMNRELDAAVPTEAVEHEAFWNPDEAQIEIYGRFTEDVTIELPQEGRHFELPAGSRVRTEISRKFRVDEVAWRLAAFDFRTEATLYDAERRYALMLFRRAADG